MKCLPSMWGWVGGRHSGEEGGAEEGREGQRERVLEETAGLKGHLRDEL